MNRFWRALLLAGLLAAGALASSGCGDEKQDPGVLSPNTREADAPSSPRGAHGSSND